MGRYVDGGEKFVSRLGSPYTGATAKNSRSLELTDRRIYFATVNAPTEDSKKIGNTTSVIDAADVSAVTITAEKPKGSFVLGLILLAAAVIVGAVIGIVSYTGGETKEIIKIILPIALGAGIGILALVACYIITYFIAKSKRVARVSIEYRGLVLSTTFVGVSDNKLEEFRQWVFRVKDKLCGRQSPPLPDFAVQEPQTSEKDEKADRKAEKAAKKLAARREREEAKAAAAKAAAAKAAEAKAAEAKMKAEQNPSETVVTVQAETVQGRQEQTANRPSVERPNDFTGL